MAANRDLTIPPFEQIWARMNVDEAAVRADTKDLRFEGGAGAVLKIGMCLGVIGFFLGVLAYFVSNTLGILIILPSVAIMGVSVFVGLKRAGAASDTFTESVGAPLMRQLLDGMASHDTVSGDASPMQAAYTPRGEVPRPLLAASGLVYDTRMVQEDVVTGRLGATDFVLADLKWRSAITPEERARENSEPSERQWREWRSVARKRLNDTGLRVTRSMVQAEAETMYWRSRRRSALEQKLADALDAKMREAHRLGPSLVFFSADFHKHFTSETYFLPRKRVRGLEAMEKREADGAGLEPMRLVGTQMPDGVDGWTSDQAEARYLVTPQLIEALNAFVAEAGSDAVAVSFTDNRMNIAVGVDTDRFSLDPTNGDIRAAAEQIYRDMVRFLRLVQDFDLNTRIWTKD